MKKYQLIIVLAFFQWACQQRHSLPQQDVGWTLVYKHDKEGNAIFGTKEKLIQAIQNGLPVKVGYGWEVNEERSLEHLTEAQFLTILKIESQHDVFAQIPPIMRQDPFKKNDSVAIKMVPEFSWRTTIGTNGISSNVMVNVFKDSLNGSNTNRRGALWFVDYPPNFEPIDQSLTFKR